MTVQQQLLPISILILAHQGDERLVACLESVQWANEILVFDYGVGDEWWKKHTELRFTRIKNAYQPITDFAHERNKALTYAQSEWVLFLDSDEFLGRTAAAELTDAVSTNDIEGFLLKRQDIFHTHPLQYGEVGDMWLLRLAKKDSLRFKRSVHEIGEVTGEISSSSVIIYHQAHHSLTEFITDVSRYAQLEAQARYVQNKTVSLLELIFYPSAKFIWNYFAKSGWKDGWRGLSYAICMSLHSFWVRIFLWELHHDKT